MVYSLSKENSPPKNNLPKFERLKEERGKNIIDLRRVDNPPFFM